MILTEEQSPLPDQVGDCTVEWQFDSTHGTHYHPGGNIHLKGDDRKSPDTIIHEMAHNIQYNIYGGTMPSPSDCPSDHYINRESGVVCAWSEGWADFYPLVVNADPVFTWPSGASLNLETPTWGTLNWDNGDRVEGRVAGALWDIFDSVDDGFDQISDGFMHIWRTIFDQNDNTFREYWDALKTSGINVTAAVDAIYQNTIDYRETLSVSLTATPSTGTAPLNGVDLTATVSGTASGTINYTFYCNRSDSGTNITYPYDYKIDATTSTTFTAYDICNYSSAGTYTAKVIAERGSAPPAEDRVTITVNAPPPNAPTSLNATAVSQTQINLSYQDNSSDESDFHIERSPDGSTGWAEITTVGANTTSYNNTGLTCNTPYYYRVRAHRHGDAQYSGYSNVANATTQACSDTTPPEAPINLTATPITWINVNSFSIDWTNPSDPSGIAGAYYKLGSAPTSNTDGTYTTNKPFNANATAQGGQAIYVWLKDGANNTSYLNRSQTTLYYDGTAPTDGTLNATLGDAQVSLSWSGFTDSGGSGLKSTDTYKVVRNTGGYPNSQCTSGTQVYLGSGNSTTDTGLTNGTTYYYRACAYDNAGNVSTGATATATPQTQTISIGEAVDNTSLTWTTDGNANWFGQSTVSYYGGDAAQSGDIADNQTSLVQTTVTGPGTLSFYWKVSSELGWDYLRFYIDGAEQPGSISGEVDWQQKTYSIPSGSHTLKWLMKRTIFIVWVLMQAGWIKLNLLH